MTTTPVNVGVIGCGNISSIYLTNCPTWEILNVVACADVVQERAAAQAAKYHVPKVYSVDELLADPAINIVLNLTIPKAHGEIALRALEAGKSVYNEKPLALTREEGQHMLQQARSNGLRVGCAPDTFLGGGLQTCRQLIDDGMIGTPVAATAFMLSHGPESWHPDPDFFYQPGAGPMFDMGPYYLTALTTLLGPVRRVTGSARITTPERTVGSGPLKGTKITVNTPTHVAGVLDFADGPVATLVTSFDVWSGEVPRIEIYGSEGSLSVPDPNTFDGPVRLRKAGATEWSDVPLTHGHTENSRGIGVADMAYGLRFGRPHRASGELAYHVLDLMHAFHDASRENRHIELASSCSRPAPLPADLPQHTLDQ
ncbi:MAG: Gfo/Idh/MocA family oxidoreductase [Herpetosiphonaceae bacterium]|nr:Gfo/Idh/MocA family oxidoreductase [Herpetosiphonaceae bacterium]